MNKSVGKGILVIATIIFMIVLIGNFFWYNFIKNEANKVVELRKVIQTESFGGDSISFLKKKIAKLEDWENQINDVFIDRNNVVGFIEQLERMARQSDVALQIENVDIQSVTDGRKDNSKELHGILKMVFQGTGTWGDVTEFLNFIEALPHQIEISSIRFTTVTSGEQLLWNVNFALTGITN